MITGGIARSFISFAPQPQRRWPIGLQAALAMAIPIAVATTLGATPLGLVCSLGAFTVLYCTNLTRGERVKVLPFVAAGLITCSVLGAFLAASLIATLIGLAAVTLIATFLSLTVRLGPPGAMMFTLVYGASARIAGPSDVGGGEIAPALVVALVVAGTMLAYAIAVTPLVIPRMRRSETTPRSLRGMLTWHPLAGEERATIVRVAVAVTLAIVVSIPLGLPRTYWIVVAMIAVVQSGRTRRHSVLRGVHRVVGTIVGVGAFALLALAHPGGYVLALVLGALQFLTEVIVVRNYALALVFITPLALTITTTAAAGSAVDVALERLVDTVVGAGIGCLALLVPARATRGSGAPGSGP